MINHFTNGFGALAVGVADLQSDAMAKAASLSVLEVSVLLIAFTRPGSRIGDVAETIGLSHSGAVRTVDRLVKEQLVKRKVGSDRRTVAVQCTAAGKIRAEKALAFRAQALERLLRAVRPNDREALQAAIGQLLRLLPRDRTDAWRICRLCEHSVCRGKNCPVGSAVE